MPEDEQSKELTKAKAVIFRLLRFRPRTEKEMREKLRTKGTPEEIITQTIEFFKRVEVINDRQFAKSWINSRLNKPFGLKRIKLELKEKGIDEETIRETTAQAAATHDEPSAVYALAKKRLTKYTRIDKLKARRRLFEYLARRGFSSASIQKALRKLYGKTNDSE